MYYYCTKGKTVTRTALSASLYYFHLLKKISLLIRQRFCEPQLEDLGSVVLYTRGALCLVLARAETPKTLKRQMDHPDLSVSDTEVPADSSVKDQLSLRSSCRSTVAPRGVLQQAPHLVAVVYNVVTVGALSSLPQDQVRLLLRAGV